MVVLRKLRKSAGGWQLPLEGTCLSQVIVDFAITLRFLASQFHSSIRIGQPLTVSAASGSSLLSSNPSSDLRPLLSLINSNVESCLAFDSGELQLSFSGGARLSVTPHPQYEAWEFESSMGERIVSVPGGALTVWSDWSQNETIKH